LFSPPSLAGAEAASSGLSPEAAIAAVTGPLLIPSAVCLAPFLAGV